MWFSSLTSVQAEGKSPSPVCMGIFYLTLWGPAGGPPINLPCSPPVQPRQERGCREGLGEATISISWRRLCL